MTFFRGLYIKKAFFGLMILSACLFLGNQSAHATASIMLDDGAGGLDPIYIVDGGTNDSNTTTGVVTYAGDYGVFDITVTTGITYPVLGSASTPEQDLNQVTITCVWDQGCTGGEYTLYTYFSEINYYTAAPTLYAVTTVGGTSDGTTSFATYADDANTLFATTTSLGSLGDYVASTNDDPFSGSTSSYFSATGTYSLTSVATVTHTAAGQNTSYDLTLNVVPEPISSTLFIVGGAALGFRRCRKKSGTA